jgi:hypothetical protein
MASLTNTKIKDTYDGLLKTTDNDALGGTYKLITDGLGNSSGVYLGTGGNVGIGQSSPTTYKLDVNGTFRAVSTAYFESGINAASYIYHSGDTNTFFGFPSNDTFTITTNNSERMRIDSSGKVGIGYVPESGHGNFNTIITGASTARFHLGFGTNGDNYFTSGSNGIQVFRSDTTERMRIDSSGILQIKNSSSPTIQLFNTGTFLQINDTLGDIDFYQSDASGAGVGVVSKIRAINESGFQGQASLTFQTGTSTSLSEQMRIDSSGNVLIGKTSSSTSTVGVELGGSGYIYATRNNNIPIVANREGTDGTVIAIRNDNSTVGSISVSGSTTSYNTSSDYRLKENVVDMTGALDRVEQLQPKRFNFISNAETTVDGFIAHEIKSVIPEAVFGEKDAVDDEGNPDYQGIDQSKIVPLLVGAIKELKAEIETLKSQINS